MTGAALGLSPYDALLDAHQPDLRDADVVPLFDGWPPSCRRCSTRSWPARRPTPEPLTARPGRSRPPGRRSSAGR